MATSKKVQLIKVALEPKPGALNQVFERFREAKINVQASWAYQMGPGQAEAQFLTQQIDQAKDVLTKMGKQPQLGWAVWVEDTDQVGSYQSVLKKIADAGVNIEATDAFAIGGKFATVVHVDQKDVEKLVQAVGAK